jgi:septal ring factor EnvC (AmiA/AmiB activator)
MAIDPNDMGRVSLINSEALQHTLGRIEEALRGLREDLHEMMVSQKAFDRRMDDVTNRVESLERWKDQRLTADGNRVKLVAALAAILFLPAIGWTTAALQKAHQVIEHVDKYSTHPKGGK